MPRQFGPPRLRGDSFDENEFRKWYSALAQKWDLNPNPDDPEHFYDYRGAFESGARPDSTGHWPSKFKTEGHPNMTVDGMNTKTGKYETPRRSNQAEDEWRPPIYATPQADSGGLPSYANQIPPDDQIENPDGPGLMDMAQGFMSKHPRLREMGERFLTGSSPEFEQMQKERGIGGVLGTPESEGSILPEWKSQPESFAGGFAKSIYEDFIRPLGSPSGLVGSSEPRVPVVKPQLALPPATRFHAGPMGIQDIEAGMPLRQSREIPYKSPESFDTSDAGLEDAYRTYARNVRVRQPGTYQKVAEEGTGIRARDIMNERRKSQTALIDEEQRRLGDRRRGGPFEVSSSDDSARAELLQKSPDADDSIGKFEPSAARTEKGGVRMDIGDRREMIRIFRNTYSGSVPHVAAKELIQNAIDATALRPDAKVVVNIDTAGRTITVGDTGAGLTREELETVYTNLSGSGKRGGEQKTIGELGVGKTTYLVAGEQARVETVSRAKDGKLRRLTFEGTPEQIMEHVDIREELVPEGTPTGTIVSVKVDEDQKFGDLERYLENLKEYSSNPVPIKVKKTGQYNWDTFELDIPAKPAIKGKSLGGEEITGTKYGITIPDEAIWGEHDQISLILSNRGMFQGVDSYYLGGKVNAPDRVVINLDPTVIGTHKDYPLTAPTRERLKDTTRYKIRDYIDKNLIDAARKNRQDEIGRIYSSLKKSPTGIHMYDSGGRFLEEEMNAIMSNPTIVQIGEQIKNIVNELHDVFPSQKFKLLGTVHRSGMVFDDGLRGVNIWNPANDKEFTILLNPFAEMKDRTPAQAANGLVHVAMHEFTHTGVREEGKNFTAFLATVYEHFDLERQIAFKRKFEQALTGGGQGYTPEVQNLLQKYIESRGRKPTTGDVLIRERGSIAPRSKEPSGVRASDRSNGEGPTQRAVGRLMEAIEASKGLREEQEGIYRAGRAQRFAKFEGVGATGREGAKRSLSKLRGEFERVEGETLNIPDSEADTLFNAVKFANITTGEKARGYTALFKILEGDVPQRNELAILNDVFGGGFAERIIEMHGGLGAVRINIAKTANTMKALMSSVDASGPMRQGIGLIHRPEWRSAFVDMFKFFANKRYFEQSMSQLERRPTYMLGRESGLFLAKPADLLNGEEAFLNSYINDLPGVKQTLGKFVGAWERGYVGFLNKLRADTFDSMINQARAAGHEPFRVIEQDGRQRIVPSKVSENLAKYINTATGRGGLGRLEKMAPELNAVIWSPRLLSSRVSMLSMPFNPSFYTEMDAFTRKQYVKSLFSLAAMGTTAVTLGVVAGGRTSTNPLSADFMKVRFGNKVIDPWSGFQQPVVAAARFITGQTEVGPQARSSTVGYFAANKASPMASLIYDLTSARKWEGGGKYTNRFGAETSVQKEVGSRFAPIFTQDMYEIIQSDPEWAEAVGLGTASFFGMGTQNYPERQTRGPLRMRRMRLTQ